MKIAAITSACLALAVGVVNAGTFHHPPATHRHLLERAIQECVIVEFKSEPLATGGKLATIKKEQETFFKALKDSNIEHTVFYTFDTLINAASICLKDASHIPRVTGISVVDSVTHKYVIPPPVAPQAIEQKGDKPQLIFAHNMTGVNIVQTGLKVYGKGIRVGIIDSGIDYVHPGLGGCFGPSCKVAFGADFVGDDFDSGTAGKDVPKPDSDPRDCGGHGTHVAGIVAANDDKVVGVAPQVQLGAYRVFGCDGSTSDEVIISALEMAYKDKMDVVNLSLGSFSSWPQAPKSKVVDRLSKLGLIVVSAMGNDGDKGLWGGSSLALTKSGFGVASFDNAFFTGQVFSIGDGKDRSFSLAQSQQPFLKDGDLAVLSPVPVVNDACDPITSDVLKGKLALIKRGSCTFIQKATNVQAAGAIGAVVYNNVPGALALSAEDPKITIPVLGISLEDGTDLLNAAAKGTVSVKFSKDPKVFPNPTGGQISSFSSWGLSPDLAIKPDIGAPGGLIFSTYPIAKGSYSTLSGTSMATPYVTGVVALYLSAKGKTKPADIKDILLNNADPKDLLSIASKTPVARQGAGMVNAFRAITGKTRVFPSRLPLDDSPNLYFADARIINIKNDGNCFMKYKISHLAAASVNATDNATPRLAEKASTVEIFPKEIVVPPRFTLPVSVVIKANTTQSRNELWLYSGYIAVTPTKEEAGYNPVYVPYAGFKGDYQQYQVWPREKDVIDLQRATTFGRPDVPPLTLPTQELNVTFTGTDFPVFRFRVLHPSPLVKVELHDFKTNKLVGYINYEPYIGRTDPNPTGTGYRRNLAWGAATVALHPEKAKDGEEPEQTPIPNGSYYVLFHAQKALGTKKETDVWRTPKININVPAPAPTNATTTATPTTKKSL